MYTADGRLAIDREGDQGGSLNASENTLRRAAIGRKIRLFSGLDACGHTAAVLSSLIATCQRQRVEPLANLLDVLTYVEAISVSRLGTLLPDHWPQQVVEYDWQSAVAN